MTESDVVGWDDRGYLRYLPPHLQEKYVEGLNDAQLTHLQRQIALVDVRIKDLLGNLDHQVLTREQVASDLRVEFPDLPELDVLKISQFIMGYLPAGFIDHRTFVRYATMIDKLEEAQLDGRIREADRYKRQLFEGIRTGRRVGDIWNSINEAMEQRRRLTEAEERRLHQSQQTISLDQAIMLARLLIESLKESVRKYVIDREIQQYILRDADKTYAEQLGIADNRPANQSVMDR